MATTTIAQEISRLTSAKADIKTAIEGKGVVVPSTTKLDGYADLIDQIEQGGAEEAPENDVNFYDYDGFRVASYTIDEAKALTALPTPPSHEGLTFQEWNWSLADIQTYDRQYADIGANYITTDGKTRMKVRMVDTYALISFIILRTGTIVIDWGDGSESTVSKDSGTGTGYASANHTYQTTGEYILKFAFTPNDENSAYGFRDRQNSLYWSNGLIIQEVNCGNYFNLTLQQRGLGNIPNDAKISFATSTELDVQYVFYASRIACLCVPRGTTYSSNIFASCVTPIIAFPRYTADYSELALNSISLRRVVFPECEDTSILLLYNSLYSMAWAKVFSIPISAQFVTRSQGDFFSSSTNMEAMDIAQGWVPTQNTRFNYSSRWDAEGMVNFFTKLGTTSTAITLTFGSGNLNKLTEEQKAIATNKGYTLA